LTYYFFELYFNFSLQYIPLVVPRLTLGNHLEAKNHTADMITFTDYALFEKWKDLPWKKRGEEYAAFKEKIANSVLESIEKRFPGFKAIVEYVEVSTPLTNEHFTSHPDGAIYGLACVPESYIKATSPFRISILSVYITHDSTHINTEFFRFHCRPLRLTRSCISTLRYKSYF